VGKQDATVLGRTTGENKRPNQGGNMAKMDLSEKKAKKRGREPKKRGSSSSKKGRA